MYDAITVNESLEIFKTGYIQFSLQKFNKQNTRIVIRDTRFVKLFSLTNFYAALVLLWLPKRI